MPAVVSRTPVKNDPGGKKKLLLLKPLNEMLESALENVAPERTGVVTDRA